MSKIAFVFPGQGAQYTGMAKDFYEKYAVSRKVFENASKASGLDVEALCFEENDKLDLTEYTQAALVTTFLAMTKVVEEKGLTPDVTAGLSLGEYCAISVAGGMAEEDAIRLVRTRGILMQNTVPAGEGGMAAILGLSAEAVEAGIQDISGVTVANYNCPGQIVITGEGKAVEQAAEVLKAAGAKRAVMLNVSGPFHSPMLKKAGEELEKEMEHMTFTELQIPYVTNVTAEYVSDISQTKTLLEEQVASSVRWQESMEKMIAEGVDTFVEIGPGKTLAGFMKKIDKSVKMYNIASWEDVEKVVGELTN